MSLFKQKLGRIGASHAAIALAVFSASAAYAQENPAPAPANAGESDGQTAPDEGLAELVVTAQRYETRLQDTPLSVVAVDGDQLAKQGTDSLSGFDTFVPNVSIGGTVAQGNAIVNVAIRGIGGAPQVFITQESAVGI